MQGLANVVITSLSPSPIILLPPSGSRNSDSDFEPTLYKDKVADSGNAENTDCTDTADTDPTDNHDTYTRKQRLILAMRNAANVSVTQEELEEERQEQLEAARRQVRAATKADDACKADYKATTTAKVAELADTRQVREEAPTIPIPSIFFTPAPTDTEDTNKEGMSAITTKDIEPFGTADIDPTNTEDTGSSTVPMISITYPPRRVPTTRC